MHFFMKASRLAPAWLSLSAPTLQGSIFCCLVAACAGSAKARRGTRAVRARRRMGWLLQEDLEFRVGRLARFSRAAVSGRQQGGAGLGYRSAAAMLPPSTVVTSAVVLRARAWARKACAPYSAVTSRPSRLPLMYS